MIRAANDFDARARTWDEDATKAERVRRVAAAIASGVPSLSGKTVLEYAPAPGSSGWRCGRWWRR